MYQLQEGWLGGYSDGHSILNPYEPPGRVAIFMADIGTDLNSSMAAATTSDPAVTRAGGSWPGKLLTQVLLDLMGSLIALLATEVTAAN